MLVYAKFLCKKNRGIINSFGVSALWNATIARHFFRILLTFFLNIENIF